MLNVHDSSGWWGVASALSTGHDEPVSYCPGGSRPRSGSGRRRWNPRVTGIDAPGSRLVRDRTGASLPWTAVDRTRPDGSAVAAAGGDRPGAATGGRPQLVCEVDRAAAVVGHDEHPAAELRQTARQLHDRVVLGQLHDPGLGVLE